MTTSSARLAIAKPTTADDFDTDEIAANWQKVDDHPGIYICTSGTRPSWGAAHEGMLILETDTDLYWRWTGAAFTRLGPSGHLGGTSRTTSVTENAGVAATVLSQAVTVPAGGRKLQISFAWPSSVGDGAAWVALGYDGSQLNRFGLWATYNPGGTWVQYHTPTAGAHTYAITLLKVGGTYHQLAATATDIMTLDVVEV